MAREKAGPLAGWKLGVTTRAEQARTGVSEPVRGFLARACALDLGAPVVTGELIRPRAEPGIVFFLGADLSCSAVTAADVLAATRGVAAGIEILDSRFLDSGSSVADLVADNASAGRYLVGAPVPPDGINLRLVGVVLEHNGQVSATASGAASLGHPAAAVAWLARSLAAAGRACAPARSCSPAVSLLACRSGPATWSWPASTASVRSSSPAGSPEGRHRETREPAGPGRGAARHGVGE